MSKFRQDSTMNTILYTSMATYVLKLEMMCMLYVYMVIAIISSIATDDS